MIEKYISRIVGIVWIITSVLWGILGVMGIFYVSNWTESTQLKFIDDFSVVGDTLESVRIVIDETTGVVSSTQKSLGTLQKSVYDASNALGDLRPVVWKTTKVVTIDVPDALDGVQESMPSLIETAKSVDETLTWLSNFKIKIPNPFGPDWSYDLGISYNPEVPLDQALDFIGQSLVEIPEDLRDLDESLSATDDNLIIVGDDLAYLADDIESTNQRLGEIAPRLEDLGGNLEEIQIAFQQTQMSIIKIFEIGRKVLIAISVLLIFTQAPSLYLGLLLARGVQYSHHPSDEYNQ